MPAHTYGNYIMNPLQVGFLIQSWAPNHFICHVLAYVMVFAFCFQVPIFTKGKFSTWIHLNQGVRLTPFWNKQLKNFSMVMILSLLTLSTHWNWTPFDEADTVPSSGFLHFISTISDNSGQQYVPCIKSHILSCQARALLLPVLLAGTMLMYKLINYFPVIQQHLVSRLLYHLITSLRILPISRLISLCDFQTCIAAYVTLDTEQLISHTKAALVDIITSLWGSDGMVIAASEVHELPSKFMVFWSVLCLNRLVIQIVFWHIFLIWLPESAMNSGLHSFPFFTTLRVLFLLVRLAFMVTSMGLWHRIEWPWCASDSRKKGSHGGWHSWFVKVYSFITTIFICCAGWYTSKNFRSEENHYFQ